jgi:hypothetical protein
MADAERPPGYWMYETTGVLRPAIEAYLLTDLPMTVEHIGAFRAYLRQWMAGPWLGSDIPALRLQIDDIDSREAIEAWLDRALDSAIDPL